MTDYRFLGSHDNYPTRRLIMVALCSTADRYILPCCFFLSISLFSFRPTSGWDPLR